MRSDVNMLLIGDPSTAKSQLLRFVLNIAPLAINTTGRGSSGVGLTAAVTSDKEVRTPLSTSVCCAWTDWLDGRAYARSRCVCVGGPWHRLHRRVRQNERRRPCCHPRGDGAADCYGFQSRHSHHPQRQVLRDGSRQSGLWPGNFHYPRLAPTTDLWGQYNRQKKPTENIGLPDSLLSRFDLLFIVLDNFNPVHDRTISDHVLRMHRYRPVGTDQALLGPQTASEAALYNSYDDDDEEEEQPVYVQINRLLHGDRREGEIFSIPFLKKYLSYAKYRSKPVLLPEAAAYISKAYSDLRCKEDLKVAVAPLAADWAN